MQELTFQFKVNSITVINGSEVNVQMIAEGIYPHRRQSLSIVVNREDVLELSIDSEFELTLTRKKLIASAEEMKELLEPGSFEVDTTHPTYEEPSNNPTTLQNTTTPSGSEPA